MLLPALVGAAITLAFVFQEEQSFRRQSLQETVRALALALDRDMARRAAMLETLAASPSLQHGQMDRFYRFASTVARQSDAAIILSDLQGRQLLNTRLPLGKPLPPMLPAERENRARLGNEVTIISDLYLPPAGLGPHSFALQVPVRRDGVVVQFLTMASFASQMQHLLAEQRLPRGWHATVIDRSGIVVARSVDAPRFVGKPVREDLAAKIRAEPEGSHEGVNLAGIPSAAFFSRAPASGWVFLVAVPKAVLNAPATRATLLLAAISLVLLGLGVAGAFAVARRVSRPVKSLREAAERLGRGEAVAPPRTGTIELDAVGAAMAGASVRLRDATAELEHRVAEAVESFERSQRALAQAQKLEALGRLTGGIAHDFNNVLQTVTASLQVLRLQARPGDAVHQDLLSRCQRAVTRGSELARQLMAFGRVQDVRVETIRIPARLADARHLFEGALSANVRLSYELPSDLWPVTVDPGATGTRPSEPGHQRARRDARGRFHRLAEE